MTRRITTDNFCLFLKYIFSFFFDMKQNNKKHSLLFTIPILAALVFGSLGTTNVFAEGGIFGVPENVSATNTDAFIGITSVSPDRQAEVEFEGKTDGWAIIGGQAYVSEIKLTGNAVHQGNGIWKVTSDAKISVADRDASLDLKGKAVNGKLRLQGTGTLESGESFRIILRGDYAPISGQPGDFVLDFSAAKIQNMENGLRIPLIQDGIIHVKSVPFLTDELVSEIDSLE